MAINAQFFAGNRARLMDALQGGLIVLSAYRRTQRGNDMAHYFEQESNFWYLCGINEPDWLLICDGRSGKSWLVEPIMEETHRVFDGSLAESEAAEVSGVDKILSHDDGMKLLRTLTRQHSVCYTIDQPAHSDYFNFTLNPSIKETQRLLERIFTKVSSCGKELTRLRAIKQAAEITAIKKAVGVTVEAFELVRQQFDSYRHEYEIEATFSHYFRSHGHNGHAYDPIVAAGNNACTLHYVKNDQKLSRRQLVLLDIGAKVEGYAADITRTYRYKEVTKRQEAVHRAVEAAHHHIVSLIKPGMLIDEYQTAVESIMRTTLLELGLADSSSEDSALRRYFPHAVSHGLGVDVHDSLGKPKYFEENMVLTVEPGIYIPEERIGVRIEDDILVTASGHTNLSGRLSTQC